MKILAIESSCDDTSVALVEIVDGRNTVIEMKTASQIDVHSRYGGVVPEIAGRLHAESITPLIEDIMQGRDKPDYLAVTSTPGLLTGLLVGVEAVKTLSWLWDIPVIPINHIEGHIYSTFLEIDPVEIIFPAICLIVSGGHTEIALMHGHGRYELIGKTRDDAAGECFDKVAKLLGINYPGGPVISRLAKEGKRDAIAFPRPMCETGNDNFDFSFSGLKTAALYWLKENAKSDGQVFQLKEEILHNFCASFEEAIVDTLAQKLVRAIRKYNPKLLILGGGVSANPNLQNRLRDEANKLDINILIPKNKYTTDNAAMIALAAYYKILSTGPTDWRQVEAHPRKSIYV